MGYCLDRVMSFLGGGCNRGLMEGGFGTFSWVYCWGNYEGLWRGRWVRGGGMFVWIVLVNGGCLGIMSNR